jgi:hypothetical protein
MSGKINSLAPSWACFYGSLGKVGVVIVFLAVKV